MLHLLFFPFAVVSGDVSEGDCSYQPAAQSEDNNDGDQCHCPICDGHINVAQT